MEKKNEYRELFKEISLRKIYFVIPNDNGNCDRARQIVDKYTDVFQREHRAVYSGVFQSQQEALKEVNMYDEQRGYFAIAKRIRQVIEIVAFIKVFVPIIFMFLCTSYSSIGSSWGVRVVFSAIIAYDLGDTITYLVGLMFLSDIQRPSANVIRSLVMLVVNYIEVQFDMAAVYLFVRNFIYNKMHRYV